MVGIVSAASGSLENNESGVRALGPGLGGRSIAGGALEGS